MRNCMSSCGQEREDRPNSPVHCRRQEREGRLSDLVGWRRKRKWERVPLIWLAKRGSCGEARQSGRRKRPSRQKESC